jgi:hypothetical protein
VLDLTRVPPVVLRRGAVTLTAADIGEEIDAEGA